MNQFVSAKEKACEIAVKDWLKDGQCVGIGSGTTVEFAVAAIARRVLNEGLKLKCVPTSFQAKELIVRHKLPLSSLELDLHLDVGFDGADEVCDDLTVIKGGGGCLLQEKVVAASTKDFIILADESKYSKKLGTKWTKGLPIEVVPFAYRPVQQWIEDQCGGEAILRPAINKMGPQITDNGNFIIDWKFDASKDYDWPSIEMKLLKIPGIVETGLFINMARKAYIGQLDGTVKTIGN